MLAFIAFMLSFAAGLPARASSFYECNVRGVLTPSETQDGAYDIAIKSSKVTDGTAVVGGPCFSVLTWSMTAEVKGEGIPTGKEITLRYRSYSGMGAEGPVTSTTWWYGPETE